MTASPLALMVLFSLHYLQMVIFLLPVQIQLDSFCSSRDRSFRNLVSERSASYIKDDLQSQQRDKSAS